MYHKFVDNLGLVVEYDLREENALQEDNVVNTYCWSILSTCIEAHLEAHV